MNRLKYLYLALFALTIVSCVDDYMDANPPLRLDAPYAYVQSSIAPTKDGIPLNGGDEVTFSVSIVDAPGVLQDITFLFSKGGEVVSHTFDQIKGKTSGEFSVTVKAPMNLEGTTTFNMEIKDAQPEPKVLTISRVLDVSYLYDGPQFTVEIADEGDDGIALEGEELEVTITIDDVPSGAIAAISVAGSLGTITFDEGALESLIGQSSGTVTGKVVVGPVASTGAYAVNVAVTDELQNRQVVESAEITYICPSAMNISGTYTAYASGETGGGDPYDNLITVVTLTQLNDGQFSIDDMSFGLFTGIYGEDDEDKPAGILNVCGLDITADGTIEDMYGDTYEITGVAVPETTNIITLEWVNTYGDGGKVTLVKNPD